MELDDGNVRQYVQYLFSMFHSVSEWVCHDLIHELESIDSF